ncbi:hypothetical protein E0F26_03830 [Candidatus Paraluminiphilus aquimaris]|uniref:DSBA-like thioredoxin domain-containing protein n=1 Tax=Candidatus Paraluminiphilus aquimaris TaxID=2518994 RepID=A0ABY6Q4X0_9GAMM|nr:DsbA family protein [Candidatus Paraluminiphilus aquimaris]UZP73926.1 hypothetical protein E0F26_03830 [Candidatus Paraluminiphilus aquimaris]
MITAYIDFKSLDCFLALDPILRLAEDCRVNVSWQPFRTKERALPTQVASESVTQSHHHVRTESERHLQRHYADIRGLNIDPSRAQVDTSAALRWLAGLEGDSSLFVKRAFSAHWIDQTDINDSAVLQELTADCGLSIRQEAIDLDSLESQAVARGLFDAPTFFIEEHMFMGRAHIPLMRQLLTDMDCH